MLDQNIIVIPLTRSTKYHGHKTIMPKTICKTHAQNHRLWVHPPSLGSPKYYQVRIKKICYHSLANPPTDGATTPLLCLTQHTMHWTSHGKNITHNKSLLPFGILTILLLQFFPILLEDGSCLTRTLFVSAEPLDDSSEESEVDTDEEKQGDRSMYHTLLSSLKSSCGSFAHVYDKR